MSNDFFSRCERDDKGRCTAGGAWSRPIPGLELKETDEGVNGNGIIDAHTTLSYFSISKHNGLTPAEVDGAHEFEAMQAVVSEAREFWTDNSPDARAIRRGDGLSGEADAEDKVRVSVNVIMTGDKGNAGAGSGGPGSAKVFWVPYSMPDRDGRMGSYADSLGTDPMYVLGHELHHAYGHDSEFDLSSDVVGVGAHLKTGMKFGNPKAVKYWLFSKSAVLGYDVNKQGKLGTMANAAGRALRYLNNKYPEELKKAAMGNIVDSEEGWNKLVEKINGIGKRRRPATNAFTLNTNDFFSICDRDNKGRCTADDNGGEDHDPATTKTLWDAVDKEGYAFTSVRTHLRESGLYDLLQPAERIELVDRVARVADDLYKTSDLSVQDRIKTVRDLREYLSGEAKAHEDPDFDKERRAFKGAEAKVYAVEKRLTDALKTYERTAKVANAFTINPFVSKAQRRWMYANDPAMAKRWEAHTPKGASLPEKVSKRVKRGKKKVTANRGPLKISLQKVRKARQKVRARRNGSPSPSKIDPSRTFVLRRTAVRALRARFSLLKSRLLKLIVEEDALGLKEKEGGGHFDLHPTLASNFDPNQPRDEHGRWTPEGEREDSGDDLKSEIRSSGSPEEIASDIRLSTLLHVTDDKGSAALRSGSIRSSSSATNAFGSGFYLSTSEEDIGNTIQMMGGEKTKVMKMSVDVKRTYEAKNLQNWEAEAVSHAGGKVKRDGTITYGKQTVSGNDTSLKAMQLRRDIAQQALKDRGYDSILARPEGHERRYFVGGHQLVVFDPKNVKVITNVLASNLSTDHRTLSWEEQLDLTSNTRWTFHTDSEKMAAFQSWLAAQIGEVLTSANEEELWRRFAEEAFKKGAGRAFDDAKGYARWEPGKEQFYAGSKQQFLRDTFARPISSDRLKALAMRSFDDLENVTADMSTRMQRTLMDGLATGISPHEVARELVEDIDIARTRGEVIARTEIIRAHAEGQLTSLEAMGVEEVGVAVEFSDTGDDRVCDECSALSGIVLTVEEAHGIIPVHPQCRCAFVPANVGENQEDQVRSKTGIDRAFKEAGFDRTVAKERPTGNIRVVNADEEQCRDDHGRFINLAISVFNDKESFFKTCERDDSPTRNAFDPDQPRDEQGRFASLGTVEHIHDTLRTAADHVGIQPHEFTPTQAARLLRMHGYEHMDEGAAAMFLESLKGDKPEKVEERTAPTGKGVSTAEVRSKLSSVAKQHRSGFAPIHALHDALGKPSMDSFHASLKQLHKEGVISLHQAEGRHGVSDREMETGILQPQLRSGREERMTHYTINRVANSSRLLDLAERVLNKNGGNV